MTEHGQLVAQFSKALDMDWLHTVKNAPWEKCCIGEWLVLGYFDILRIYDLPHRSDSHGWLNDVWDNSIKLSSTLNGTTYFHPLYLAARDEKVNDFWKDYMEKRPPVLFFTLLQGAARPNEGENPKLVSGKELADMIWSLPVAPARACYHTIELSDMVVLWSAADLSKLMETLQTVYADPLVGDVTTFAAIDYNVLWKGEWGRFKELDAQIHVLTEYVVRSAYDAQLYLDKLEEVFSLKTRLFGVGPEDVRIFGGEMSVRQLLEFLRAHITDEILKQHYENAFTESTTKLSIPLQQIGVRKAVVAPLREKYVAMLSRMSALKRHGQYDFMKQLCNLLNVLVNMSQSCVLDGYCFLIYDAVEMFCANVERLACDGAINNDQMERIHRFLRGLGALTEQATRVDGRFIQMPGFSPILCEVPAHLLELYQYVSNSFARLLCCKEKPTNMALLLLPKLCRRVKVYSIFENRNWMEKCEAAPDDQLLYVDIPLDVLYDPALVLCCLGHEISHFVGNLWRNRQGRYEYIRFIAAYELSQRLKMPEVAVMDTISMGLDRYLSSYGDYLEVLEQALARAVEMLLREDRDFDNWREAYLNTARGREMEPYQRREWEIQCAAARQRMQAWPKGVARYFRNLFYLFKECFADLCMISLVSPDRATYLRIAKQEVEQFYGKNQGDDAEWYQMFVERWGLVLSLDIWPNESVDDGVDRALIWLREDCGGEQEAFKQHIQEFLVWLKDETGNCYNDSGVGRYHDHETIRQTRNYLCGCVEEIKKSLDDEAVRAEQNCLHGYFEMLKKPDQIDWPKCEDLIFEYRGRTIEGNR